MSQLIKYVHNCPKKDFDIFVIPEVIFVVRALKFDTVGPFTRLPNMNDPFNEISVSVYLTNVKHFALLNMRACNARSFS